MTPAGAIGISSVSSIGYGGGAPSATTLQAQLQRYEKQLSECVNCASAKTPQGKADIQAISTRISQVKERIAQTENAPSSRAAIGTPVSAASATTGTGNLIDVFA